MRALITGGTGFVGRHLANYLVSCGDDVACCYRAVANEGLSPEEAHYESSIPLDKRVQTLGLDVCDQGGVRKLVELLRPDAVYHLAAQTFVPDGERSFAGVMQVNFQGSINLFEAVRDISPKTKILYISSSEVYGIPRPGSLPLKESSELRPITNYGVSKAAADLAAFKFAQRDNLDICIARPFPHVGPGQSERFALSSFSKQLAEIKLGKREPVIEVGNLESKRDYSDVSDIIRGYYEALNNGKRGSAYNFCSGKSEPMSDLLQGLIELAEVEVEVKVDESRYRPSEIGDFHGSYSLAEKDLGWKPRVAREPMLHGLLAFWLESLSNS